MDFIKKSSVLIILILFFSSIANASTIYLTCYMNNSNAPMESPHNIEIDPNGKVFQIPSAYAIGKLKMSRDYYGGSYEMGVNVKFYIDRNTGGITYVLSKDGREKYHEGFCKKTSSKQKF